MDARCALTTQTKDIKMANQAKPEKAPKLPKAPQSVESPQKWEETKAKIHSKFSKLSTADLDGLKGHMDQLTSKVQKAYNYDKSKAETECKAFNKTLGA